MKSNSSVVYTPHPTPTGAGAHLYKKSMNTLCLYTEGKVTHSYSDFVTCCCCIQNEEFSDRCFYPFLLLRQHSFHHHHLVLPVFEVGREFAQTIKVVGACVWA